MNLRGLNIHGHAVDHLLVTCLVLPLGQQRTRIIGLGYPVAYRKAQCELGFESGNLPVNKEL